MTPRNIALVLLFAALPCSAQQPALTVDAILAHIRDNVAEFKQSIPAFIADETVLSQRFQSGVLAEQVHLDSSFEMQRSSPDGPMHETRHIKLANGVPPKDPHKVRLPWAFSGGFADVINFVGSKCDDFRLADSPDPQTLVVLATPKPAASDRPVSCGPSTYLVKAIIDPQTFQILHLEQTTQDAELKLSMMAHMPFVEAFPENRNNVLAWTVDYAPVELGGKTYWLTKTVTCDMTDKKEKKPIHLHYEARYTNYHRFTSTSTILPIQ